LGFIIECPQAREQLISNFTIGDINVDGNADPEEIGQKVEGGVKRGATEAITGTQGIIRREIDQNQLIDVGE